MASLFILLIGILVFALVLSIGILYNSLSWGVVLWCFWDWFLLPVFPTLPPLTFWHAVGLMFVIDLFKNQVFPPSPTFKPEFITDDGKKNQTIALYVAPWIVLLIGYLMYLFISVVA